MSQDKINLRVSLKCQKCGNPSVSLPDEPGDYQIVTCPACGADLGTVGQLNSEIKKGAAKIAEDMLKKALKDAVGNSRHIKLKF